MSQMWIVHRVYGEWQFRRTAGGGQEAHRAGEGGCRYDSVLGSPVVAGLCQTQMAGHGRGAGSAVGADDRQFPGVGGLCGEERGERRPTEPRQPQFRHDGGPGAAYPARGRPRELQLHHGHGTVEGGDRLGSARRVRSQRGSLQGLPGAHGAVRHVCARQDLQD